MDITDTPFPARAARFEALTWAVADWSAPTPLRRLDHGRHFRSRHRHPAGVPRRSWCGSRRSARQRRPGICLGGTPGGDGGRADSAGGRRPAFVGYIGPTTIGATIADFYGWDLVIHGWDLAGSDGLASSLDESESQEMLAGLSAWGRPCTPRASAASPLPSLTMPPHRTGWWVPSAVTRTGPPVPRP